MRMYRARITLPCSLCFKLLAPGRRLYTDAQGVGGCEAEVITPAAAPAVPTLLYMSGATSIGTTSVSIDVASPTSATSADTTTSSSATSTFRTTSTTSNLLVLIKVLLVLCFTLSHAVGVIP
jgi:hypothetical protein